MPQHPSCNVGLSTSLSPDSLDYEYASSPLAPNPMTASESFKLDDMHDYLPEVLDSQMQEPYGIPEDIEAFNYYFFDPVTNTYPFRHHVTRKPPSLSVFKKSLKSTKFLSPITFQLQKMIFASLI